CLLGSVSAEAGDLIFALVNFLRAHKIPAEDALRAANAKFERRFKHMEALAEGRFAALTLDEQEALWRKVKKAEKPR
ncbi:MAG: nucleoside triphosphate pyrophosphohydrolase, partial [Erythrobacter sp.]